MILDEVGIPTGPLLASAGIVGIAVGFGRRPSSSDVISGVFMLIEDQYGVGDVVDLGDASGVVEAVGLRVTRIRDVNGTVWYIRNGQVLRVGNQSQGWARAVLDVGIAYGEDVARAERILLDVANSLRDDEKFGPLVIEEPEMWGIESVTADSVVLRLVVKTQPLQQWAVARELRRRIKDRFDAEGIHVAHPQSAVRVAGDAPCPDATRRGRRGSAAPGGRTVTRLLRRERGPAPSPGAPGAPGRRPARSRPGCPSGSSRAGRACPAAAPRC